MTEKEKTAGEQLAEQLCYAPKTVFEAIAAGDLKTDTVSPVDWKKEIHHFCEEYKTFLDAGKTEREVVKEAVKLAKAAGFAEYVRGGSYRPGDKLYAVNREKGIFLFVLGRRPLSEGINLTAAHIDSPRIDLKVRPLYEDSGLCFLKTHYYGGVKKYQWTAMPLALHGVVCLKNGEKVIVTVGEEEGDPVFCITDLLPHLGHEQEAKPLREAIVAEKMNVLVGSEPFEDEKVSEKLKLRVLSLLHEKYGMTEYDFLSADLSFVPVYRARDIGFDRSMIGAYGHDDRVCAYTALRSILEVESPERTCLCALVDREEIGSDGVTGMQSNFMYNLIDSLCEMEGVSSHGIFAESRCLSADVAAAFDPNYADAYDKRNASLLGCGVAVIKYTGSGGKYNTSDAGAEYMAEVRDILDGAGVIWQTGSMGRVDLGGGGTVAKYIANHDIDTVDVGVPVLSMHSPFEVVSKGDVYMTYRAFCAFNAR